MAKKPVIIASFIRSKIELYHRFPPAKPLEIPDLL
jgi:hypothetical protein